MSPMTTSAANISNPTSEAASRDGEVISDYDRFKTALSQIVGKRLTYKVLIGKTEDERPEEEVPF